MGKPSSERVLDDERLPADGESARAYDAGDPAHVGEKRNRTKTIELERAAGFKALTSTRQGRAWLWDLLTQCNVFHTSFTGNSTTFFNEGRRDVGLKLIAQLTRQSPDDYVTMIKENSNG